MMPRPISRGIFVAVHWRSRCPLLLPRRLPRKRNPPPKALRRRLKARPPTADAAQQHFNSAQTYQLAGDFEGAAKEYRRAIAIGLDHLGNLRGARHDYAAAEQLLKQALAVDPDNPDPTVDLAITELYSGDIPKAEADAKTVLQKNPDHVPRPRPPRQN